MRRKLTQMLSFGYSIASMLMLYTGLGLAANTSSPIVVVLSGSMEPGFRRGDVLLLTNPSPPMYSNGDIVVYKLPSQDVPIVHRVIQSFNVAESAADSHGAPTRFTPSTTDQLMMTKGDNNPVDDLELYDGLEYIQPKHVVGKVRGFVPYIGYLTIWINEEPKVKYALFGALVLLVQNSGIHFHLSGRIRNDAEDMTCTVSNMRFVH